ncbi:MAG: polymer-forming cytoskeletal protein [Calditrichaceae bacterium]|nr:polymer-forming cytoskeletal protein [Calditrichaceae bacterium]MBN2709274.1 polymer-forming cytoskeletal protein [Calditrichaceae bacterium]RQV96227.1 MAG: hypothetical protein EH224_05845 [Calditrichota bacterium]
MYRAIIFSLLFIAAPFILTGKTSYKSGDRFELSKGDTLSGDLFFGGRMLDVFGTVESDVVAGGQLITIEGNVGDDVYAGCETLNIKGNIGGGVIGAGKMIVISGKVTGDVRAYGGYVEISDGSEISGDLYVGTGHLRVRNALIHGGIYGGAGETDLDGKIGKDIILETDHISFGKSFSSSGEVKITLPEKPAGALKNAPDNLEISVKSKKHFYSSFSFYWFLIAAFVIGVIILVLFRPVYDNVIAYGDEKFLTSAGVGILFIVIMPLLAILAITVLPLAFILAALYAIVLYLSQIFTAFWGGHYIFMKILPSKKINPYLSFLTGLVILTLLFEIPVIGFFVELLTLIIGCGTFIYYLIKLREKQNHITV